MNEFDEGYEQPKTDAPADAQPETSTTSPAEGVEVTTVDAPPAEEQEGVVVGERVDQTVEYSNDPRYTGNLKSHDPEAKDPNFVETEDVPAEESGEDSKTPSE